MEYGTAYTLALWRVKEGREEEFVEMWKGDLTDFFFSLPHPPGPGTLIRSVEDPQLFYSFGPWRSLEDIQQMRSHPQAREMLGRLADLCDEAKPGSFRVVATVAPTDTREQAPGSERPTTTQLGGEPSDVLPANTGELLPPETDETPPTAPGAV